MRVSKLLKKCGNVDCTKKVVYIE